MSSSLFQPIQDADYLTPSRMDKSPCAIDVLPPELLLEIFAQNTLEIYSPERLTTARYSSQVCQLWRSILLSSTFLWGRLLNLDSVVYASDEWRKEVVLRVGDAMLWIVGVVSDSRSHSFLMSLLREKWETVQLLQVDVELPEMLEEMRAIMLRKAPNLKTLKVRILRPRVYKLIALYDDSPRTLFDDFAPKLARFELDLVRSFNSNASWIFNLRSIEFSSHYSAPFILSVLKSAPSLTTLLVRRIRPGVARSAVTKHENIASFDIHLPRLRYLYLDGQHFLDVYLFLKLIKPSPGCILGVSKIRGVEAHMGDTSTNMLLENLYGEMVKWASAYINLHRPKSAYLSMNYPIFQSIPSVQIGCTKDEFGVPESSLSLQFTLYSYGYNAIQQLATCSGLSAVRDLDLSSVPQIEDPLFPLYRAFSSVTKLTVVRCCPDLVGAFHIEDSQPQSQFPIFPLLYNFRPVSAGEPSPWLDFDYTHYILDFLEYRAGVGLPILSLDLSYCRHTVLTFGEENWSRIASRALGVKVTLPDYCLSL
ncbi:hypothetical protein D9613_004874 [Agrocybe pediades]|uniref:F-box domain-containing protein n=1 Tax=Agrocybe pediades TaxID=84607 RepID=A0A8H4QZJ7_9AGAR|nr:hypothetical protein D9613_004874 [Agrocybe pediades]